MAKAPTLAMLPWWPRDYLAATRSMTLAERGAYTDLLWFAWDTGVLPNDPSRLARMLGVSSEEFEAVWPGIKLKFVLTDAGGIVNERLERERAKATANRAKASEKAAKAAEARWVKENARSIPESNGQQDAAASHDAPSNAPGNAPSIESESKLQKNMLGAMLEQCPPTPTPTPTPTPSPSPTPTLGECREPRISTNGSPERTRAAINGNSKEPENTREKARKAVKSWADWGDAEIARVAKLSIEDIQQARRDLTAEVPS
jgi:uncharacterized protein YdaU (DUF1376 family)